MHCSLLYVCSLPKHPDRYNLKMAGHPQSIYVMDGTNFGSIVVDITTWSNPCLSAIIIVKMYLSLLCRYWCLSSLLSLYLNHTLMSQDMSDQEAPQVARRAPENMMGISDRPQSSGPC